MDDGRGGKKEIDSNRRRKLVSTSTSRVTQDVDYPMEEGARIATNSIVFEYLTMNTPTMANFGNVCPLGAWEKVHGLTILYSQCGHRLCPDGEDGGSPWKGEEQQAQLSPSESQNHLSRQFNFHASVPCPPTLTPGPLSPFSTPADPLRAYLVPRNPAISPNSRACPCRSCHRPLALSTLSSSRNLSHPLQGLPSPLLRCPSQRLLDRVVRRYAEVADAGSIFMDHFTDRDKLRLLYTLAVNAHPILLQWGSAVVTAEERGVGAGEEGRRGMATFVARGSPEGLCGGGQL
eukprot:bmy_07124T0